MYKILLLFCTISVCLGADAGSGARLAATGSGVPDFSNPFGSVYRIPTREVMAAESRPPESRAMATAASTSNPSPLEQLSTYRDKVEHLVRSRPGEESEPLTILRNIMLIRGEHEDPYISYFCGFAIMRFSRFSSPLFEEARRNNLDIIMGTERRASLESRIDCALRMLGFLNEEPVGPRLLESFKSSETGKLALGLLEVGYNSRISSIIRVYSLSFVSYADYVRPEQRDLAKTMLKRLAEDAEIPERERILASEVLLNCRAPLSADLHLGFGTPTGKIEEVMGRAAAVSTSDRGGATLRRALSEYIKPRSGE